ncbi:uncharacterized protein Z520_01914 [Fonsecaea multimorphosa CBS 102226]|uniref:Uncharacterized protein n=1 Tax=Fonsecaea multimorphosa CBS 102226 TaxID=1442371 RepID=A0A0D2HIN1_9EURO|nr:uncharacterized protein Z520_01914 [Fonsecaea multimorphosa CBS 102226]KIY01776.1 hypothetical protein Z520_01914 [Fonsecaea multimorphosa CBS 102226]OAL29969.1 hypothetical protein AYO22_01875 [Fonsecaea multimorphosa]
MPLEIADSDAESDFDSPVKRPAAHEPGKENPLPTLASAPPIVRDEYLDPTQKLSSSVSLHLSDFNQLDGSTDITVARIADLQTTTLFGEILSGMTAKKRAHSALQDSIGDSLHEEPSGDPKVKRSKTYGAGSKSRTQDDNLFAPPPECALGTRDPEPTDQDRDAADHTASDIRPMSDDLNMPLLTDTSNQTGVIPLLERSLADSSHCMTTSMASMGKYQSINIDFRGAGQGLDVNTNPFGSLSQVSLREEHNQARPENPTDLVEVNEAQSTHVGGNQHMVSFHEPWQDHSLQVSSQSSPPRSQAVDPARIMRKEGAPFYADRPSHFQIPEIVSDMPDPANATGNVAMSMEKASAPRKRGRKAKNSRLSSKSPAPSVDNDPDDTAFSVLANSTRARRGTLESLSQASQISAKDPPSKKRKRGKSTQIDEEEPAGDAPESFGWDHPTGDLNLSEEAVIGLPKEAYKPRPSRSRSKAFVENETEQQTAEFSLVTQPTSELNLSDEAVIGLPKEAYKPRPSRARSKKFIDEDETLLAPLAADDEHRTPAKSNSNIGIEQETPTITAAKSSTKKGRKSKVKRAKTSAAALLKKADPMLSDGEEDVVWMDSKPAPVKLDLPPDLKALKKESDAPKSEEEDEHRQKIDQVKSGKSSNISIEIPNHPEVKNPVVEPKKRGRKPKKTGPQQQEQKAHEERGEERESHSKARSPLVEKSTNLLTGTNKSLTEKDLTQAPTVSPITSPEPEAEPRAPAEENDAVSGAGNRNEPITTPARPKPAAPPSSAEKGPTKHSPINPPSLSSSGRKVIYRVGLSRRQNIPSLLRKVDRDKPPPKNVVRKEKESKKKKDADADYEGEDGAARPGEMRGPDGMLIEWEF